MGIRILIDSASDISKETADKLGLDLLPLKVIFGKEEFLDSITLSGKAFYEKLIETEDIPTTSQITPYDYKTKFEEIKKSGDIGICITLSSKLSGTYQSANIALDGYEDCIFLVDSENVSIGEQALINLAVTLRDQGKSAKEIVDLLNKYKKQIRVIALLDTLEYLKKGGRISPAAAMVGAMLSIKPVITVKDGEISVLGKARGSKSGNNLLMRFVKDNGGINFSLPFCLGYTGLSDALLQKYIKDSSCLYEDITYELPISIIGCAIGTHLGPNAIGIAFFAGNIN